MMTFNSRGLLGRLFWIASVIQGMSTLITSTQTTVHNRISSSLEPEIAIKMDPSNPCDSIEVNNLLTSNSDLFTEFITYLLMGSLPAPIKCNNVVILALFPSARLLMGGWGNVVWRSRLLEYIWELGLSSYK